MMKRKITPSMQKAAQASAARAARRNGALSNSSLPLGDMLAAGSRRHLSALNADFSVCSELTSLPDATDRISALSASVATYKAQVERALFPRHAAAQHLAANSASNVCVYQLTFFGPQALYKVRIKYV